jgi:threonine synthase
VDAYKSIAFEVYEQLGESAPDVVAAPVAYCDGIYGVYKGMRDLLDMGHIARLPRMVGGEVSGSLGETLRRGGGDAVAMEERQTAAFSVGTNITTRQGVEALAQSGGFARSAGEEEILDMQRRLAAYEGIYAENASVLPLIAVGKLAKEGRIRPEDKVGALITSTGLRDTETTARHLPAPPSIQSPSLRELQAALKNAYGYDL